jgi:acetyltransferase-like isoleucine patch superfamily enzyme
VPPARVTTPEGIEIGDDVFVDEHAWLSVIPAIEGLDPRFTVGSRTRIGRFCSIACCGDIEIGADVVMSERVFIGDTYHEYEDVTEPVIRQPMAQPEKVIIGRGAFLGIGSVVVHGVTIGEQAYVGAGAVVTADVPPRSVVVGNPARVVRSYDEGSDSWIDVQPAAGADRQEAVGL